ncbi:Hypothetical protein SMAX5B_001988 [Scophthalmus maximus]|uniref:Small integral membrane protein 26 n=1 Tax=Scophthalmus maximus TaxID=52904 RepID=A0A2U9BQ65_SCOMX|nr:small integral membrane protein 26 [Scophthalmus maximus]AWP06244.1 Hypothetical protein SMAX5B_001988 [Scophthalmus maximus]KAF0037845.1 hypothetical protein F2P81_010719 [Scophthalmus maximus]
MMPKSLLSWNKRVSAVYAFGMWTLIGSYALLKYTGRIEDTPVRKEEEEEVVQEQEDPNQVVLQTTHTKTLMVYKKDFVPYTSRISKFISSFSGDPGTGGSDK